MGRSHGFDWSPERQAELTRLWVTTATVAEMAAAIGVTAGSIEGMAKRLKLHRARPNGLLRSWTLETLEEVRRMWGEGISARLIGDALGVTKNSAIGAIHRLHLPHRITRGSAKMRPKIPHTFERKIHQRPDQRATNVPAVPMDRKPTELVDLGLRQCHFPLWDHTHKAGEPKFYCGAAVVASTSWCASCLAVVAKPLEPRQRKVGYYR